MKENKQDWVAGLIDGDGYFSFSKKGHAALEITIDSRDQRCLHEVKKYFGGAIKPGRTLQHSPQSGGRGKWYRYKVHNKAGLLNVIRVVNGRLRNPIRILQLARICEAYNITLLDTPKLSYNNSWLSGLIDSDGSVYLNKSAVQVYITVSQKNKLMLDILEDIYGGKVYANGKTGNFKWVVSRKQEVLNLLDYFKEHPLMSKKMVRVNLIKDVYTGFKNSWYNKPESSLERKQWSYLMLKWTDYS